MSGLGRSAAAGQKLIGANEDMFLQAFDSTPKLNIATQKKLENELARVVAIISNQSADWDHRVQAMKLFRSLVNSGIADQDDFYSTTLRNLEIPFQNNICDLRSQVVRETCITIAFLSCRLQQKFSRMAENVLPSLIKLIPNSAKIVSTSALVALRFIIQSTHSSKMITIIKYQLSTSKSKEIHKALCEIIERIATSWPPQIIDRQVNDFVEVLRLGICDSDELARQYSRRAYNAFAENFREHADRLFNSLDSQRQRMLNNLNHGGGSTLSMNGYGGSATSGLNTVAVTTSSVTHHHQHHHPPQVMSRLKSTLSSSNTSNGASSTSSSASSGSSIPTPNMALSHVYLTANRTTASPSRIRTPTARSTSVIDEDAQRRARARASDEDARRRAHARAIYLSSMYQRPRQLGGHNNHVTPSPIKSNLPQPIHGMASAMNQSPFTPTHSSVSHNHHPITTPSTPLSQIGHSTTIFQTPLSSHKSNIQYSQNGNHTLLSSVSKLPHHQQMTSGDQGRSPTCDVQQRVEVPAPTEKPNGETLSKAATYLSSIMRDTSIDESQIVTTLKYFNTLIDKQSSDLIRQLLSELMHPLTTGLNNSAISIRKTTVFAMVAIYAKVGLNDMEPFLNSLTITQRKLLEVYIKKHEEDSQKRIEQMTNDVVQQASTTQVQPAASFNVM